MDFICYLAMTEAEFSCAEVLPVHPAWMACHYSCYGVGLSGLPERMPEGSLLIVNDRTPPSGHDPQIISQQLKQFIQQYRLTQVLLDLQRDGLTENHCLAQRLVQELGVPVAVSEKYASSLECPVFLDCPPPYRTLEACAKKWPGRELWLELAPEVGIAEVTAEGFIYKSIQQEVSTQFPFYDADLCCKYRTQLYDDRLQVTMKRDEEALKGLCLQAQTMDIHTFVGLYQQFGADFTPKHSANQIPTCK